MHADEAQAIVYVDESEIRDGALDELDGAIEELVGFIDANVPRILAYNVYVNEERGEMTVVHVHASAASLDHHLEVGGPAFRRFADLLTLRSIRVYGEPSEKALEQLHAKARMLGDADIAVLLPRAGFSRLGAR